MYWEVIDDGSEEVCGKMSVVQTYVDMNNECTLCLNFQCFNDYFVSENKVGIQRSIISEKLYFQR